MTDVGALAWIVVGVFALLLYGLLGTFVHFDSRLWRLREDVSAREQRLREEFREREQSLRAEIRELQQSRPA